VKKTNLKAKADRIFSKFVRLSHSDSEGRVKCYTCGIAKHWKSLHAGHYINRRVLATRYDLVNVKPQCTSCNTFNEGDKPRFAIRLEEEYGNGILQELHKQSFKLYPTLPEQRDLFNHIIEYYKDKVKELENTSK
jgi:hypothetical protein